MREAVIEQKAGVHGMRDDLDKARQLLVLQQAELTTAERRRELAASIQDTETVAVADKFIARLRERVGGAGAQGLGANRGAGPRRAGPRRNDHAARDAAKRNPAIASERSTEAAWQGLERGGMDRPDVDLESELLKGRMERAAREANADARLEELKKRMGRE